MTPLVLASTSPYRRELLLRLGLPFTAEKPIFDEDSAKHTLLDARFQPRELCLFLGREKARSLARTDNCVIGGDQMLVLNGKIFGKPGTFEKACAQLLEMQGKTHELLTSFSVFFQGQEDSFLDVTRLTMAPLSDRQIEQYVQADQPLDCAGSYKIEKQGIALFEKIETEDFTAIQGLPLLRLTQILKKWGYSVPGPALK
jgi:septum formation protein